MMRLQWPGIWSNSSVENPCENYFCSEESPDVIKLSLNPNVTEEDRYTFVELHNKLQTYCTICEDSFRQNFTFILETRQCKHYNRTYCGPSVCETNEHGPSTCVALLPEFPVCYAWNYGYYVFRNDAVHHIMLSVYLFWTSVIIFFLGSFKLILVVTLLIIPEIYTIIHKWREYKYVSKVTLFINFRNFYITIITVNNVLMIALCFLDVTWLYIGFGGRYRNMSNFITLSVIILLFIGLLLNWIYILQKTADLQGRKTNRIWIFVVIIAGISFVWCGIGLLFYFLSAPPKTSWMSRTMHERLTAFGRYAGGTWLILSTILFDLTLIGLIIFAVRILRKLMLIDAASKSSGEIAQNVLGIRMTKMLISCSCLIFVSSAFAFWNGVQYLTASDILSLPFHFLMNLGMNLWVIFALIGIVHLFTDYDAVYQIWRLAKVLPKA